MNHYYRALSILTVLVCLAAPAAATDHVVEMINLTFVPNTINIDVGDKITWTNNSVFVHTTTSGSPCTPDGVWDSGFLTDTQQFSFTFTTTGVVPYFCIPHCGFAMTGTVVVAGVVPTEESTWGAIKDLFSIETTD